MKTKNIKTLQFVFARPPSGNVKWDAIEAVLKDLGAQIEEREGSRVLVRLFCDRRVFHRPHPSPDTGKGALRDVRNWLESHGVNPHA